MSKYRKLLFFLAAFAAIFVVFVSANTLRAQTAGNSTQRDAIGIRVIPNPNHFSVARWYQNQGFSGSPQTLTVDGYEALRDGRTVYVNAAHVVKASKTIYTNTIYTNIYMISYNQDYDVKTVDILGQIVSNWKFNDNLEPETATCSISAVKCDKNADCASNQVCNLGSGTCALKEARYCETDNECPANFFCDSLKAKIIRDLKRVGRVEEIREGLAQYYNTNRRYPLLDAGTYLSGKTTSLWPSWNQTFLPAIGLSTGTSDPINRFGPCSNFDPSTCWNKDTQKFATISNAGDASLTLPHGSYALVYSTNSSGSQYNICSVMETRTPSLGYTLSPNDPASSSCVTDIGIFATGQSANTPPQIDGLSLKGVTGQEYNGFIRAVDADGDPVSFEISGGSWGGWSGTPVIRGTHDPYQKRIFAQKAGPPGSYPINISVSDSRGSVTNTMANIEIVPGTYLFEVNEYNYRLDPTIPFSYSFYVSGSSLSYTINRVFSTDDRDILRLSGITAATVSDGVDRSKVTYQGIINTTEKFDKDLEAIYELKIGAGGEQVVTNRFVIRLKIDKPILNLNCATQSRVGHDYNCFLGDVRQGNHTINYAAVSALPAGLEIKESDEDGKVYLAGKTPTFKQGQEIKIKATNQYGTVTEKSFILDVNTYCGDGQLDKPNSEGKGGLYNNGYEACDGSVGVALTAASSSRWSQYACNTPPGTIVPYPIPNNSYCIFKSPLDGGGYCGDTFCQTKYENNETGTDKYCPFDCDPNYAGTNVQRPEDPGELSCEFLRDCDDNSECVNGVCVKKCWDRKETTREVLIRAGDAVRPGEYTYGIDNCVPVFGCQKTTKTFTLNHLKGYPATGPAIICEGKDFDVSKAAQCTVIALDNPLCLGNSLSKASCPVGANDYIFDLSPLPSGDLCKPALNAASDWEKRARAMCLGNEIVNVCVGEPCRTTLGKTVKDGTMNSAGACIRNQVIIIPDDRCLSDSECQVGESCAGASGVCADNGTKQGDDGCSQYNYDSCIQNYSSCDWEVTSYGVCTSSGGDDTSFAPPEPPVIPPSCSPTCTVGICGDDGCGGTCPCFPGSTCQNGTCVCDTGCAYYVQNNPYYRYDCQSSNNFCSPGGGYCGDGYCQDRIKEPLEYSSGNYWAGEDNSNCPQDCRLVDCECPENYQCGRYTCPGTNRSKLCGGSGLCPGAASGGWQSYQCENNRCIPVQKPNCGNGVIDEFEICDDGDNNIELADIPKREDMFYGWFSTNFCTKYNCLRVLVRHPRCGDGICDFDIARSPEKCGEICLAGNGLPHRDCLDDPRCN